MLVIAIWWWFIAAPTNDPQAARQFGPYASQALCRIVAHALMPDDPIFRTKASPQTERDIAAARARLLAQVPHTEGRHRLADGSLVYFDKNGKEAIDPFPPTMPGTTPKPTYRAITNCVKGDE